MDSEQVHINTLVKLLKTKPKYSNLTNDEILSMFETVEDLEDEVNRLIDINAEYKESAALYEEETQKNLMKSTMLTGVEDVNYRILLNMDIKELSRYCQLNTAAQKICNNENFWITKIQNEITNQLHPRNIYGVKAYIRQQYPIIDKLQQQFYDNMIINKSWLQKYDLLLKASKYAGYILDIYDVEFQTDDTQIIAITAGKFVLLLILSMYIDPDIFDNILNRDMYHVIYISYTFDYDYQLQIRSKQQPIIHTIYMNKNEVKNILTRALFYQNVFTIIQIKDNALFPYIYDNVPDSNTADRRYGMFQVLNNKK